MIYEFKLPDLGEGIAEAEIRSWMAKEGDLIEEHQAVVEVETDKALVELPSPWAGRVLKLYPLANAIVQVGDILLTIEAPSEIDERPPSYGIVGVLPEAEDVPSENGQRMTAVSARKSLRAMPGVRKLARDLGVLLEQVAGTGPDGVITEQDVQATNGKAREVYKTEPMPQRGVRRVIARRLLAAQQQTAFVTTMDEFNVSRLWDLKHRERPQLEERELHLTFLPFFMKAVQHALLEYPRFNARLDEVSNELLLQSDCHLGIAVDTAEGLMVPVLRDVGRKSIIDLATELQKLSKQAEQRSIALEDLQGSTFTLSNFGAYGGYYATPIINIPNAAILGCGRISQRPWVVDGELAVRYVLPLSLTFDHRITDGAEACLFLTRIGQYLEDPGLLFIESV